MSANGLCRSNTDTLPTLCLHLRTDCEGFEKREVVVYRKLSPRLSVQPDPVAQTFKLRPSVESPYVYAQHTMRGIPKNPKQQK